MNEGRSRGQGNPSRPRSRWLTFLAMVSGQAAAELGGRPVGRTGQAEATKKFHGVLGRLHLRLLLDEQVVRCQSPPPIVHIVTSIRPSMFMGIRPHSQGD